MWVSYNSRQTQTFYDLEISVLPSTAGIIDMHYHNWIRLVYLYRYIKGLTNRKLKTEIPLLTQKNC